MLEIYLDAPVVILETFRLRGAGGAYVGGPDDAPGPASAVVGTSLRVGGTTGEQAVDAFRTHAHRFCVLVARDLDDDEAAVVRDLVALHRPAHTLASIRALGSGMRVGVGLHLAVSTLVGPGSGFAPAVVGDSALGRDTVLGRGRAGLRPGVARLGEGTVIDP
jgi:hypothetical protein